MKKIIIFIFLVLLTLSLASCEFPQFDFSGNTNDPTVEPTNGSNSNETLDNETENPSTNSGSSNNQENSGSSNSGSSSGSGSGNSSNSGSSSESGSGSSSNSGSSSGSGSGSSSDSGSTSGSGSSTDSGNTQAKFTISEPSFETRKITSIDEITMDDFFNLGNKVDIKIHITSTELNKLQKDFETGHKSEIYRLASKVVISLTNSGTTYKWEYENVGIRQKGNTSRTNIFDDNGDLYLNHYKLSFDETFNDPNMYDSTFINKYGNDTYADREFLGMSGLDFKWNKNYDATHIREVYANYLYRAAGVLAQHSGLSNFSIVQTDKKNKTSSFGLCTVYEPATKSFIKRSLKSDESYINMGDWKTEKAGTFGVPEVNYGDLYKCVYGANLTNSSVSGNNIGISNISGTYIPLYDRKTNKDVSYNDILLRNAVSAISSGDYNRISQYVDLEYLAISEAVGYFVGNPDSMRYNMNNYMIYMRRTDGKMVFIPIDSDRCFGITKDWNPRDAYMYTTPLDRKDSTGQNTISLLLNTILSNSDNDAKKLYLEYVDKLSKSTWLTNETFNKFYNMAKTSYSEHNFSLNDDNNNVSFGKYISNKLVSAGKVDNNNSGNNNSSANQTTDVYLVSTVNNWNATNQYKMTKVNDNTYTITISVTKLENDGNYIKFKFNNGGSDYSKIDWSINQSSGKLSLTGGSSYKYYDVKVGDVLTITINTSTLDVTIEKNK